MSDDAAQYGMILRFPDQSESFVLGFEAGPVWHRLRSGETPIDTRGEMPLHRANEQLYRDMADVCGYLVEFMPIDECWMNAAFDKIRRRFKVIPGGVKEPTDAE